MLRFQKDFRPHLSFSYRFRPSTLQRRPREKPHGRVCPPFWILTVEWSGVRSCLFWWRHRFQILSFFSVHTRKGVFKEHRFQIAPLWRAFSNGSVIGDCFQRCCVDDSHIRSKTAPFSFENRLVWTGLNTNKVLRYAWFRNDFFSRDGFSRSSSQLAMASKNVLDSSYYAFEYMKEYKNRKKKTMLETLTYICMKRL